jgi:hypothetical protein
LRISPGRSRMLLLGKAELAMFVLCCRLATMGLSVGGCEFVGADGAGSCLRIVGMFLALRVFERQCVWGLSSSSLEAGE